MEQGSFSAKSPPNSYQRKHSFTDDLRAIVNSSSSQYFSAERESRYGISEISEYQTSYFGGALNFSQSNQTQFSTAPLQGEMLSHFHGENSAAYGNLQSRDQHLYEASQSFNSNSAMISGEEAPYDEMMNRYNLSSSNMPPQFHLLTSSSTNGGVQIGSSHTLVPFESSGIDASGNTNYYSAAHAQTNEMTHENLDSMRSMRSQGFLYPLSRPNGFDDLGIDISNNGKSPTTSSLMVPFESSMSGLLNDVTAQKIYSVQQTQNNAATVEASLPFRYTLYDKRYEDVGLPVDPHLRIFIATNGNGNGESSSR